MKRIIFFVALFAAANVVASQQRVSISRGFFTGRDYFEMSDTEKRAYATGAVNGMLVAPFFGAPEERLAWFKTCHREIVGRGDCRNPHPVHQRQFRSARNESQRGHLQRAERCLRQEKPAVSISQLTNASDAE